MSACIEAHRPVLLRTRRAEEIFGPVGWSVHLQDSLSCRGKQPSLPFPSGMGSYPEDLRLHQPHSAPRSPGALACRAGGEVASSTFANYLWDKSEAFRCKSFWEILLLLRMWFWDIKGGHDVPSYQTWGPAIFQSLIHQKVSKSGGTMLGTFLKALQ